MRGRTAFEELEVPLPTRRATIRLARRLASSLAAGDLVVLGGPLGVGKTFFVRAVCRALGLPSSVAVTSPTYTLVHQYDTEPPIAHADFFRLGSAEEARDLGLDALRAEGWVVLVEWGEPFVATLGGDGLAVTMLLEPRRALVHPTGSRSEAVERALKVDP